LNNPVRMDQPITDYWHLHRFTSYKKLRIPLLSVIDQGTLGL